MTDSSTLVLSSLGDALPEGRNAVFAGARPFSAAPAFSPPFPLREEGVLFGGKTLPAFGIFAGVPEELRAACAANVVVHSAEGPDRFLVELTSEDTSARVLVGRTSRRATLGETVEPLAAEARKGPSLWSRLRGKTRFGADDVLKVPPVGVEADEVRFRLAGGGGPAPASDLTLGRGEMYTRYFVCDGPFVVLLLSSATDAIDLALWVEDAAALS